MPGARSGDESGPPVTLCVVLSDSLLVQITVVFGRIVMFSGMNEMCSIDTRTTGGSDAWDAGTTASMAIPTASVSVVAADTRESPTARWRRVRGERRRKSSTTRMRAKSLSWGLGSRLGEVEDPEEHDQDVV